MILCKIMNNSEDEVANLLSAKLAVKYKGVEIDAMKVIMDQQGGLYKVLFCRL